MRAEIGRHNHLVEFQLEMYTLHANDHESTPRIDLGITSKF